MSGPAGETSLDSRRDEVLAEFLIASEAQPQVLADWIARYPDLKSDLESLAGDRQFVAAAFGEPLSEPPPCFGDDYELVEELDRGGEGAVYKAYQRSMQRIVAIKALHQSSSQPDPDRIRTEAQRAATLSGHHHIVKVHVVDEYQGQRFFVMQYLEGKSLTRLLDCGPLTPSLAVQYVKTIAGAVHYAHQRQILHCDLKPRNILLDEAGEPCIADFGLSKRLGDDGVHLLSSVVEGTASYMAPEQASRGMLTTETDIHGLGAILYALLTAQPPFQADTLEETLRLVRDEPPQPPGALNPAVDKDLEAICMKCLSKDRKDRYASAYGLVRDLERYQAGEETVARAWGGGERAIRWIRRRPAAAAAVFAVILVSLLTAAAAFSIKQNRGERIIALASQANASAASNLARAALLQLRDWSNQVNLFATDKQLLALLKRADHAGLQRYAEGLFLESPDSRITINFLVLDKAGFMVARTGPESIEGRPGFDWRDYFRGPAAHAGLRGRNLVHISRAYNSTYDGHQKFTIAAPVVEGGKFLGVVGASITTGTTFGLATIQDPTQKVALIVPIDREERQASMPDSFLVMVHPGYEPGSAAITLRGNARIAPPAMADHVHELDDSRTPGSPWPDYIDPVGTVDSKYKGLWTAGFAPVGNTGFFVIVQQRPSDALGADSDSLASWTLATGVALIASIAMAMVVAIALSVLARRRAALARASIS